MKNHDDEEEEEEENVVGLPPCALKNFEEVLVEADNKEVLVFLDYDGTLSPIVTDPNKAYISEETRKAVLEVSTRFRTSIISGRSVDKVKNFVGLPHLFYAGSHGMDIEGPDVGISGQTTQGTTNRVKHRPEGLDQNEAAGARDELSERTAGIEGVTVEDNKFCCSVHFRNCKDPTSVDRVERIVREVSDERGLDVKRGRKVFEVRPRVTWNKGNALDYLMSVFEVTQKTGFPIYLGDDKTDEDAFAKLRELGCGRGVLVSTKVKPTQAHYSVKDPTEVLEFLRLLSRWGKSRDEPEGRIRIEALALAGTHRRSAANPRHTRRGTRKGGCAAMNRLVNIWAGNRQHILKYPQGRHHHHATWRGWNQEKRGRNKVTLVCRAKVEGGGGAGVGITEPRAMIPPTTGRPTTGKFERPPRIAQVLSAPAKAKGENSEEGEYAEVFGWVRSSRAQKSVAFVDVSDGSCSAGLQVVASASNAPDAHALVAGGECTTGCSVRVRGRLVESRAKGQRRELQCEEIEVLGACPADEYPLQKKKHSLEFLRSIAHLRPRTRTIQSAARVRSTLTQQTHAFFAKNGFSYVNTPVITRSDCEGAGEAFRVTTMAPEGSGVGGEEELERAKDAVAAQGLVVKEAKARAKERGESPNEFAKEEISRLLELKRECEALEQASAGQEGNEDDFFGGPAFLTVSGQLEAETYACALRDVYTFGPTFRAENSNTNRHLAEFWMLEPELAFAGLDDVIACAEAYIKHCLVSVLEERAEDLDFLHSSSSASTAEGSEPRTEMLRRFSTCVWHRITYTEAVDLLVEAQRDGKCDFEFEVKWGSDLQTEHERWLCEVAFGGSPLFVTDYPKDIKAFYMRLNEDGKTVSAVDLLVPGVGELVGGSAREERIEILERNMEGHGVADQLWWYRDLRKYGTVKHAGFGLGFERLVQLCTGLENIRDVTPFPRYPGHCEF